MDGEEERRVEESEMDGAGSSPGKRRRGRTPGSRNQTDRSRLDSTTKRKDGGGGDEGGGGHAAPCKRQNISDS
jgi:hypothetical protein